jgi:hypothetical protein
VCTSLIQPHCTSLPSMVSNLCRPKSRYLSHRVCMTMRQMLILILYDKLGTSPIQYYSSMSLLRMMCTLIRP